MWRYSCLYSQLFMGCLGVSGLVVVMYLLSDMSNRLPLLVLMSILFTLFFSFGVSYIRRSHQMVRREAIAEMRTMLKDVVTNQIALIYVNMMLTRPASDRHAENVLRAAETLQHAVSGLSEEALAEWQHKYAQTLASTAAVSSHIDMGRAG